MISAGVGITKWYLRTEELIYTFNPPVLVVGLSHSGGTVVFVDPSETIIGDYTILSLDFTEGALAVNQIPFREGTWKVTLYEGAQFTTDLNLLKKVRAEELWQSKS